ncbi:PilN domain-containing protein [Oceanimonas marisflavi]|uniref:PilN domain-containing protein n=1 Tax=Oceanimonas marisflavi TaxID=2059724 RepID=UPI001E5A5418|nr:PilN domain-containing protein [Oceanimonas marisflavi]
MDGDSMTHRLGRYGRQLTQELARFWGWWSGQLLALLPASLRRRLFRAGQQLCIYADKAQYRLELQPDGPSHALTDLAPAERQQLLQKAIRIRLCLPASELLLTQLTLPAATAGNLENVLRFEMDRHTPFTADQVYFGFKSGPREKNSPQLQVTLLLAPKERVDARLAELAALGLVPATLCATGNPDAPTIPLPLPRNGAGQRTGRLKNLNGILVLVMLFLLIAVPLYHRQSRIEALTAELEIPRQRAEQAAALKRELAALRDSRAFLSQKRAERAPTLPLLDELTRQLPDHTWLSRLQLENGTVQIRGESANASELISLLENSALFSDVRFSSPITNNPATSKDRFMITARLGEGGAP